MCNTHWSTIASAIFPKPTMLEPNKYPSITYFLDTYPACICYQENYSIRYIYIHDEYNSIIMKKSIIEEVIPFIKEWVRFVGFYENVPGISVAMQLDKELLLDFSVGKKDLETGEALKPDNLFRIASHSKLFTATGIMELYAQDKLSLDDRVSKYLDWFKPKNDNIRIRHLLNHTGGISRDSEFGQWHTHKFPSEKEFEDLVASGVEIIDPAIQIKYSNIAYTMLGRILERVSGIKYEKYMYDLCQRLGMSNTYPEIGDNAEKHTIFKLNSRITVVLNLLYPNKT